MFANKNALWIKLPIACIALIHLLAMTPADLSGGPHDPNDIPSIYSWYRVGPKGGIIPSVKFHPGPASAGVVWASGDDGSGLYKSTDYGQTWAIDENAPPNQSSYALRFGQINGKSILYAPNYFGWGMLTLDEDSNIWNFDPAGLPDCVNPTCSVPEGKKVYDLAIDPTNNNRIYAATHTGLYESLDGGVSFTKLTALADQDFRALAFDDGGGLYVGEGNGDVNYRANPSDVWTLYLDGTLPVADIELSANAVYVAYEMGVLWRLPFSNNETAKVLNSPTSPMPIVSGLTTTLSVVSGSGTSGDTIYFGTSEDPGNPSTNWGLFKSMNGGDNFAQVAGAIAGNSVFSIDVDPNDENNVVVGTLDNGIYYSTDKGVNFSQSVMDIYANPTLGVAQGYVNTSRFIISTAIGGGRGKYYETIDAFEEWSEFEPNLPRDPNSPSEPDLPVDSVLSFELDPIDPNEVLAGTFATGIYKTNSGLMGTWTRVLKEARKIDRMIRDIANPTSIYAVALDPNDPAIPPELYYSGDNGGSFELRVNKHYFDVAPHPDPTNASNIAIGAGLGDVYSTIDGFMSETPLGLGGQMIGSEIDSNFTAVAFDPNDPSTVLVGGASGAIYRTTNFSTSGNVMWESLGNPISDAVIRKILITENTGQNYYYVAAWGADTKFMPGTTNGLYRSTNGGATWHRISEHVRPSDMIWNIHPDKRLPNRLFVAAMWGGDLIQLVDFEQPPGC